MPYFSFKVRTCARATNSNKTDVGVETTRLTGASLKNEAHLVPPFVACFRHRARRRGLERHVKSVLKCSATGKPGFFFSMLRRCSPRRCLSVRPVLPM